MNDRCRKIAEQIYQGPLTPLLDEYLTDLDNACQRAGGYLVSRQMIALALSTSSMFDVITELCDLEPLDLPEGQAEYDNAFKAGYEQALQDHGLMEGDLNYDPEN